MMIPIKNRKLKGQGQMLEYVLLMVIVVAVILMLMLFLTWWQLSQLKAEESKGQQTRLLNLMNLISDSPYLAKENSMMDSAKMTAFLLLPDACDKLRDIYGPEWHANIRLLDGEQKTECRQTNYPDCNYWELCPESENKGKITRIIPINVYHNIGFILEDSNAILPRTYLATLNVTAYV
jgi:hypothetical protein